MRYVGDTFVVIDKDRAQDFTDNIINSLDPHIKFTSDPEKKDVCHFGHLVTHQADGSVKVSVYIKPTHTDQYLAFESHHRLEHKLSVIRTLFHRADTVVTDPEDQQSEKEYVKTALRRCGYENWSFKRECIKKNKTQVAANIDSTKSTTTNKTFVVAPYVQGVSEKLRRVFFSAVTASPYFQAISDLT